MKFLVVDDHAVVREGLAALLRQADPGTIVIHANNAAEGLALAESHCDLDALVLDLAMPGMAGTAAIEKFGQLRPDVPVIVLSASEDPSDVQRALASGALGYVPKSAKSQTILSALQLVLSGEKYLPPLLLHSPTLTPRPPGNSAGIEQLTGRQFEVLKLLTQGLANKEIANALGLSEKTVKAHVGAIFRTLNVVNRTQAASAAHERGLI